MAEPSFQPDWFSKPGDTLSALMSRRDISHGDLAELLEFDLAELRGLLAGTVSIDEEIAQRLSMCVGGTPSFWIKRQSLYEAALHRAAQNLSKEAGVAWLRKFPSKEISDFGWIEKHTTSIDSIKSYLAYFGVTSPNEWEQRYAQFLTDVAFRTSPSFESKIGALSAWLRQGEIVANAISTDKWNGGLLKRQLPTLRKLSKRKTASTFASELKTICASAGVALVFVRAPSGCRASGASRFISADKAMIILSFRYLTDDHFWFTLFHEIGHLILHGKNSTFIDGEPIPDNDREAEANAFAASVLIPMERHDELFSLQPRMAPIVRFAVSVGVAPGIVVGQMQHLGVLGPNKLNFLKRRYEWSELETTFD